MKRTAVFAMLLSLTLTGCPEEPDAGPEAGSTTAAMATEQAAMAPAGEAAAQASAEPSAAATVIQLTPENTQIQFVGTHADSKVKPDPNARHGQFKEFSGKATVEGDKLASVQVEIITKSLDTGNQKLNAHLNNADFFDTDEYPTATFTTTSIETQEEGAQGPHDVMIIGDLTLHGVTKSVSFPATVSTDDGLMLNAEFPIDRTQFGMNYSTEKVDKDVALTITVDD